MAFVEEFLWKGKPLRGREEWAKSLINPKNKLQIQVGKTPFGDTEREIAFRVWLCWAQSPGFLLITFFNVAPCLWYAPPFSNIL